jgi:D-Tyr-tRNAtyr deacylase
MKAVVQRVTHASVKVDGETKGEPCLDIDVMGILDSYRIQPISFIPFQ